MTPKQVKYAKQLRSQIILTAKNQGMTKPELYQVMPAWGFDMTLSKYGVNELLEIMGCLRGENPDTDFEGKHSSVGNGYNEYPGIVWSPAKGMATVGQQKYVIILYRHYAKLRGIPNNEWYKRFHGWLKKYVKADHVGFCKVGQASKAIYMLEREIATTFGDDALQRLRSTKSQKDNNHEKHEKHESKDK